MDFRYIPGTIELKVLESNPFSGSGLPGVPYSVMIILPLASAFASAVDLRKQYDTNGFMFICYCKHKTK